MPDEAAQSADASCSRPPTSPDFRLEVHRLADEVARWASGDPGSGGEPAAVRVRRAGVSGGQRWGGSDAAHPGGSDGALASLVARRPAARATPSWARAAGASWCRRYRSGAAFVVPGSQTALNITPVFSPDGRTLAFAHSDERGTDIYTANVVDRCCAQRLTVGRYRGQLKPNVFARRAAHRVHFDAGRTAPVVRDGSGRNRPGAAGALRFRRHRKFECS